LHDSLRHLTLFLYPQVLHFELESGQHKGATEMKKLILLLFPLFLSAGQDYKEVPTQPKYLLCDRCSKNKLHDDRIKLAIQCSIAYATIIVGSQGFMYGKTYLKKTSLAAILAILYSGVTYELLSSIGLWVQDKLLALNSDYRCSNPLFCQYASQYRHSN
jgi:hypothetical protein